MSRTRRQIRIDPWVWRRPMLACAALLSLPLFVGCDDHHHGCWNCSTQSPAEVSPGLVAGNFNQNGFASLIAASTVFYYPNFNAGNLKLYLSSGAGSFAAPTLTAAGDDPQYLAAADVNGDGLPDVVSVSADDGTLTVFFNNAQTPGTFNVPLVLSSPGASQVAIGDINGDGLADLVSADYTVSLFVQTSPGTFASPVNLYSGGANWVAIGDLNGDGAADIALTDAAGVKLLMHTGAPGSTTFSAPVSVLTASVAGANLLAVADVNGDGLNDLVVTDPGASAGQPGVYVLLQDPAHLGQFLAPVAYATGTGLARSLLVADVNGDGRADIVIGSKNGVSVLLQSGTSAGSFVAAATYPIAYGGELALADVNGDGLVDIVVPTGVSHPTVNGVQTNNPGALLQNAASPGTFGPLQDLP